MKWRGCSDFCSDFIVILHRFCSDFKANMGAPIYFLGWVTTLSQVDSMDNSKSYLPRYLEHSKDQVQKERLPSKITGCTMYSGFYEKQRKVVFYLNHDVYENGSNMIITIIYNLIQDFANEHKMLPKKLHLNLDNCWKGSFQNYLIFPLQYISGATAPLILAHVRKNNKKKRTKKFQKWMIL